jgi:hypothetical protein
MLGATGFLLKRNRNEQKKHRLYSKLKRRDNKLNSSDSERNKRNLD